MPRSLPLLRAAAAAACWCSASSITLTTYRDALIAAGGGARRDAPPRARAGKASPPSASSSSSPPPPLGAEFADRPSSFVNIAPVVSSNGWLASTANGSAASVDADGYPTEDAFAIFFDAAPWAGDPQPFVPPDFYGTYSIEFSGKADIVLGPGLPLYLHNQTFDEATWTTRAAVDLGVPTPLLPVPGMALGFFNSFRTPTSGVGTGITRLRVLQPGFSVWDASLPAFIPEAMDSAALVAPLRLMTVMGTNDFVPSGRTLQWADRRRWTDSVWGRTDVPRTGALNGWPLEAVVLLGQAQAQAKGRARERGRAHGTGGAEGGAAALQGASLWINVHVASTGASPADTSSLVYQTALLLRDGNAYTGSTGLPPGSVLYVEHGNEVWLNGTAGGPSASYLWNFDAAKAEVEEGGSPLNSDGSTSPEVWCQRRHLKRLSEIRAIFTAVFASAPSVELRFTLGGFQDTISDMDTALLWFTTTFPSTPPSQVFYGLAINSYVATYPVQTWSQEDIVTGLLLASDEALPARQASAAVAAKHGLQALLSYEGMVFAIPGDGNGDNVTWSNIMQLSRSAFITPLLKYDYEVNFAPLSPSSGPGAYNFFALVSEYGPFPALTWGLSEDIRNTSTPKWAAVKEMLGLQP